MAGMASPRVSVITPTYNRADYLPGVIESVLGQGETAIEYVVLDDGSTDDTAEAVRPYLDRIVFSRHENMGETRTVNRGFEMVTGEIIGVINSDDPVYRGAVDAAVEALDQNPDVVVVYPDWDYIDPDGAVIEHHRVEEYDYARMLSEHICMPGPAAFFRRSVVEATGGRDASFRYVGDFDFWLRAALVGPFMRIPRTLATFRVHPSSASVAAKGRVMAEEDIRMLDRYYARDDLPAVAHRVRQQAYASAHLHASQVSGRARLLGLSHIARAVGYDAGALFRKDIGRRRRRATARAVADVLGLGRAARSVLKGSG